MMDVSETLPQLERIMNEFFSPATSNERKREIEVLLSNFSNQEYAWRDCLNFLFATNNDYVAMYSLTTLEKVICKRWVGMPGHEKTEIRTRLNDYLTKNHNRAPGFIVNKLMKLIVDIAGTDWPHFYPDFFSNIMECIYTEKNLLLGLGLLLTTSEELATPRENISSNRKEELRRLLCGQVTQILSSLTMVLETLLPSFVAIIDNSPSGKGSSSTTPPPSPTPSRQDDDSSDDGDDDASTTSALLNVASNKILAGEIKSRLLAVPSDLKTVETAELALKVLTHVFSWVPLTTAITPRLLSAVFYFTALGLHSTEPSQEVSCSHSNLAILAMGTTNEIVYRHCVPSDFEDFLLQMFQNTCRLLQMIIEPSANNDGKSKLHLLDEQYVNKFTEFLLSFVKNHLRRFENDARFLILEFLSLLFKYTFDQPRTNQYLECLEIWMVCLEYIGGTLKTRSTPEGHIIVSRYREALNALVVEVLSHVEFRRYQQNLEELDDENLDDNDETEWQHYLRGCIEVIVKVSELFPDDVLQVVDSSWKEAIQGYLQLDANLAVNNGKLVLASEQECLQLHCLLRDFSSLLQLVGRLSVLFVGESFEERLAGGHEFMNRLIIISTFGSKHQLYSVETQIAVLSVDLIEVHSQALAALKAWSQWLAQLHNLSSREPAYQAQCTDLTSRIMISVSPVLKEAGNCNKLVHSAAHFMVTLTGTVRPPSIWKLREFTELYNGLHLIKLNQDDHLLMVRSLANVLLLPWPGIPDQKWDDRAKYLSRFIKDLTEPFRNLKTLPNFTNSKELQDQARPMVVHTLKIIGDLVDNVLNEGTQTKRLCHDCIKEYIEIAHALFPIYINDTAVCEELFAFFHTILDVLKTLLGADLVEQIMDTFLTLFSESQLHALLLTESTGAKVVEKFLQILQFIVKESDPSFRKFIDRALSHCLDVIYPIVADKPAAEIKVPLFGVLFNVLMYNWRHFFRSSAFRTLMGGSQNQQDQVAHHAHFLAIMQAFGQSFLQSDISIFKQNLEGLESLNAKWKLYHKPLFVERLIVDFLKVFLDVLELKSHDLLKEEIILAIYNMASVSFEAFFDRFLVEYLEKITSLDANQKTILKNAFKTDVDLPTFTLNIDRFVNDLRYYKLCNASLPSGSVSLGL